MSEKPAPVASERRIASLDVLRGFAVLGILVINIQSFSMISAAYLNPSANDKIEGVGYWVWATSFLLADTKFISIFSMLYGAGIALLAERLQVRGLPTLGVHYRRTFWLLVFGLAHAHLLWYGDILVPYALLGFVVYWFRNLRPRTLLLLGFGAVSVVVLLWGMAGLSISQWPEEQLEAQRAAWAPPPEAVQEEIEAYRGGFLDQQPKRSEQALFLETFVFLFLFAWRSGGLMLVGMAFYKLGVISAERAPGFYRKMMLLGFGLGFPIVLAGIVYNTRAGFALEKSQFQGSLFNYVGSVGVFLGYVAMVMLAVKTGFLPGFQRRLAAAGRMAFTNYIAQSVICTLLFYGHGLGLFERVERVGQLAIVIAIWTLQLWWSPWWLARFRFGPLEWLWRSLTYLRRQPFRIAPPEGEAHA